MDQSVDLRRGCYLVQVNSFVECTCEGAVPKSLVVDLANATKGKAYKLRDIQFPPGVAPTKNMNADYVAGVIKGGRA